MLGTGRILALGALTLIVALAGLRAFDAFGEQAGERARAVAESATGSGRATALIVVAFVLVGTVAAVAALRAHRAGSSS
jgi:predicted xylose isomerase-like sugar epimerase